VRRIGITLWADEFHRYTAAQEFADKLNHNQTCHCPEAGGSWAIEGTGGEFR